MGAHQYIPPRKVQRKIVVLEAVVVMDVVLVRIDDHLVQRHSNPLPAVQEERVRLHEDGVEHKEPYVDWHLA